MLKVKTYIKNNKIITNLTNINEIYYEYFVCCTDENCLSVVEDFDYLEGAIIISIDGATIMDFSYWDLVDQLWTYLIDSFDSLLMGEKQIEFYFPDQPISVKIENISQALLSLTIEEKKYHVNRKEFFKEMLKNAEIFFEILSKCGYTSLEEHSKRYLKKIEKMKEYEKYG